MCVVSKRIVAIKMILGDCNLNAISRNLASEHTTAKVAFINARTRNGRRYEDAYVPLSKLLR